MPLYNKYRNDLVLRNSFLNNRMIRKKYVSSKSPQSVITATLITYMLITFDLLQSGQNLIVLTLELILFPHIIICEA